MWPPGAPTPTSRRATCPTRWAPRGARRPRPDPRAARPQRAGVRRSCGLRSIDPVGYARRAGAFRPMPASRLAQLLLPSGSLGLRAYDVLEEAVFLGPGKHGVVAGPLPFPKAALALTWDGGGFVVRSLPGEPPVQVNGEPAEGRRLVDGDRVALGGETVLVRMDAPAAPPAPPRAAEAATAARRPAGPRRVVRPRAGWNHLTWVLGLGGL